MIKIMMTRILIIIEAKVMAIVIVIAKNKVIKEKKKFNRNW